MATERRPLKWPVWASIAFSIAVLSIVLWGRFAVTPSLSPGRSPLSYFVANIDPLHRMDYFDAMRTFANSNGFEIRIAPIDQNNLEFGVDLYRSDIVVLSDNILDYGSYKIGVYSNSEQPLPASTTDPLVARLRDVLAKVPGLSLTTRQ